MKTQMLLNVFWLHCAVTKWYLALDIDNKSHFSIGNQPSNHIQHEHFTKGDLITESFSLRFKSP